MAAGFRDYVSNFGLRERRRVAEQLTVDHRRGADNPVMPAGANPANRPAGALRPESLESGFA